jgi:hypothetical protein
MYDFSGPPPDVSRMRAANYAKKVARNKREFERRIREHPNQFFFGDIVAVWVPLMFVAIFAVGLILASIFLPPLFVEWLSSSNQKTEWIAAAALVVGISAWYIRERQRFKLYPIGEIAFGTALSVQGVVQQNVHSEHFSLIATVVSFVAGVRILIDGLKRFDDFRTGWLFTRTGRKYLWRQSTRTLRALRYG